MPARRNDRNAGKTEGGAGPGPDTVELADGDLAALIAGLGPAGALSPFGKLAAGATAPASGKAPDGRWRDAATALHNPALRITAAAGDRGGLRSLILYAGGGASGSLYAHAQPGEGRHALAGPFAPRDALAVALSAVADGPAVSDPLLGLDLEPDAFLALAALLDAQQEARLTSMLARDSAPLSSVGDTAVAIALKAGRLCDDYRWLVPVALRLLPEQPDLPDKELARALGALRDLGIADGDRASGWRISPDHAALQLAFGVPLGWGLLGIVSETGTGLDYAQIGVLRTQSAVWLAQYAGGETPLMRFGTLSPATAVAALGELVERAHLGSGGARADRDADKRPAAAQPAKDDRFCTACGTEIAPGSKFCTNCGTPLQT